MNTEALGKSKIGYNIVKVLAGIMESKLRYKFFGPDKILAGAKILPGEKIFEIGCGTGFFTIPLSRKLRENGELVAMDISSLSVEMVKNKVKNDGCENVIIRQGNALKSGLESNSFDHVVIFGVLPAPGLPIRELMDEMHRILKVNGHLSLWPATWVQKEISHTGLFTYVSKKNGVINYEYV